MDIEAKDPVAELDSAGNRLLKQYRDLSKRRGRSDPNIASAVSSLHRKVQRLLSEVA